VAVVAAAAVAVDAAAAAVATKLPALPFDRLSLLQSLLMWKSAGRREILFDRSSIPQTPASLEAGSIALAAAGILTTIGY
jgi:hypothetical protein